MATPGGSDTSLCLLAWQCGPSGRGGLCSQDSCTSQAAAVRYVPGHSHLLWSLLWPCSLLVCTRESVKTGVQGGGTARAQEWSARGKRRPQGQEFCLQLSGGWQKLLAKARDGTQHHSGAQGAPSESAAQAVPAAPCAAMSLHSAWALSPWGLMCFTAPERHQAAAPLHVSHVKQCALGASRLCSVLTPEQRLLEASPL